MKRNQRTVYYYDFHLSPGKAELAPIPTMSEFADAIHKVYEFGVRNKSFVKLKREKGQVFYHIGDVKIDKINSVLKFIVHRCDMMAANPASRNIKTGEQKIYRRSHDEGGETAAHVAVSLIPYKPDVYKAVIEGTVGITHAHIQPLLNHMIASARTMDIYKFKYADTFKKDKSGKPKEHIFVPILFLRGHIADTLKNDIENGKMQWIELVEEKGKAQVGGSPYLLENKLALKIGVQNTIPQKGRFDLIKNAISNITKQKRNFSMAKICFKTPDGVSHTVNFDINLGYAIQQMYVKSILINGITPPLDSSSEKIADHFMNMMVEELKK